MGEKSQPKQQFKIEPDKYSESSKRSYGHEILLRNHGYYEDITYQCSMCDETTVFSAEDQKYTYEVRKLYMYARRYLCQACYQTELKLKIFSLQYDKNKEEKSKDEAFLREWLHLSKESNSDDNFAFIEQRLARLDKKNDG